MVDLALSLLEISTLQRLLCTCAVLALIAAPSVLQAQDLPLVRQYFSVNPSVLAAATEVPATPVPKASGSVLVIFRRGASSRVVDAQAIGGSPAMQQSALASVRQWQFQPYSVNGAPVQFINAASFVFNKGKVTVEPSPMMSAGQLSPRLRFPCPNALAHHDTGAVDLCRQQLDDVLKSPLSTDLERITAQDEYGLALLYAHQLKLALSSLTEAMKLAPQVYRPSDPELALLYLHRAEAEAQDGDNAASQQDRDAAKVLLGALSSESNPDTQAFYRHLLQQFDLPALSTVPTT